MLSGTGSDGVLGARAIKESGGLVLVQDPHDAAHGDMPRAVAHSGEEALAAAREFRPAVAFVDLAMPGMSGAELARRLREEFPDNGITLVAVTRCGEPYQAASGASFDHRLLKPVTADHAAALLNSLA